MSMIEKCARALALTDIEPEYLDDLWTDPEAETDRRAYRRAARAVLSVLMEADEGMLNAAEALDNPDAGVFVGREAASSVFSAMIRHLLNEETHGRLPSGRAGGADAPQPAPRAHR